MTAGDFKPVFATTTCPVKTRPPPALQNLLKDSFKLPTLLAIGALMQALVVSLLPARYSLLPVVLVLGRSVVSTVIQARSPKANPFTLDVIPGRVTAQLPSPAARGPLGPGPAGQPLVVFHLGARFNHPLGLLSPGAREMGGHLAAMARALDERRDEFGMLHVGSWRGAERQSNNTLMTIAYFRDAGGLNRFAHDRAHREGWDWYVRFARREGNSHIGIFHETFVARAGDYETIYVDCPPMLLGASNIRVGGEGGGETWVRPLVSADHAALRTQSQRMATGLPFEGEEGMY